MEFLDNNFIDAEKIKYLSPLNKQFIYELLKKRYFITQELEFKGTRKSRRNEEKFKFVFKRAMKFLFKQFKR